MTKSLIRDTYSGVVGRGIHDGYKRVKEAIKQYQGKPLYILKVDIKKFYMNINNDILKEKLRRKFKDKLILDICDKIIDSHKEGLPIGNYLSQHFANFYLNEFDHYIKDELGVKHYFRYCDDMVFLAEDKNYLKDIFYKVVEFLKKEGLTLKRNYQIYPIERSGNLDFLGYVYTRKDVRLRKTTERKFYKRVRMCKKYPTLKNILTLSSYNGWIKYCRNGMRLWFS